MEKMLQNRSELITENDETAWIQNLSGFIFIEIKLNGELLYNIYKSIKSTGRRSIIKRV
jgi:hypothetical protein